MLHEPSAGKMRVILTVILTFVAKIMKNLPDFSLFQILQDLRLGLVLYDLTMFTYYWLAFNAKTLLDAMPVYDRAI